MSQDYLLNEKIGQAFYVRLNNQLDTSHQELQTLLTAGRMGSLHILQSYTSEPIGYIAYACVTGYTLRMLTKTQGKIVHLFEWREGRIVYIVDVVINRQQCKLARRRLREFLRAQRVFAYFRNDILQIRVQKRRRL